MGQHVRRGDEVIVSSGKQRGRTGTVLRVMPKRGLVVVQGINVHKKHMRPNDVNPQGGMIEKELPIHLSNVSPVVDDRPTRVRFETRKDGSKVRVAVRGGKPLGRELVTVRK